MCEVGNVMAYESFTAPSTGHRFTLYATPSNFSSAEASCNAAGGHLATFETLQEQHEVSRAGGGVLAGWCWRWRTVLLMLPWLLCSGSSACAHSRSSSVPMTGTI
jgi:hypothetical protein